MSLIHLRPAPPLRRGLLLSQPLLLRTSTNTYATHSSASRRRNVTVLSDDGRYTWGELSGKEKVARATQQSFNFMVVLAGAVLTGGVFTLLYTEVFSPNSRTWQFEKAVERIKNDARCINMLGDRREIKAYGENTWSRWARNRPIATKVEKDRQGREHLKMNFHVAGPRNEGVVFVHMVKPSDTNEWEYRLLALEVKGYSRVVLEERHDPKVGGEVKIFGIRWK
ncbi:protein tim21 [Aspergillus puulaauensis]|uniref:Mitochondrial import inner membrane translocase subunit Tim21 n=1 Tax=Aspergillus puulaauensis TaxID=1220207 RepID=A0A7R8AI56_9EURO|nr:mitochondrial import inner membrane translocase subunit tim21 [Aspergillus puulaauensis]BCS18295.1 mitochondrial import inner membrane translocase subunit tim21 [Aspergillus puulaauensis]